MNETNVKVLSCSNSAGIVRSRKQGRKDALSFYGRVLKRGFDFIASLIGIIVFSPFMAMIYFCIRREDGGPAIFKQERIGYKGKAFMLYKFRSMYVDAESRLNDYLTPEQLEQWNKERKIDNDPRITKVGAFLRKTSLDEFPQFINVFLGHMSLVGPRPVVPDEADNYKKNKSKFLSIRPGLTGYWASNGRSNISYAKRMKMELYYVDHCSFGLHPDRRSSHTG